MDAALNAIPEVADDEAHAARDALVRVAPHRIWERAVDTESVRRSRRGRLVAARGQPPAGVAAALADLDAYDGDALTLGFVDDRPSGGHYFHLFLTEDRTRVVAVFGVRLSPRDAS